jgi:hypothetical protein
MDNYILVEETMEVVVMHCIKAISMNLYRGSEKVNDIGESESFLNDLF